MPARPGQTQNSFGRIGGTLTNAATDATLRAFAGAFREDVTVTLYPVTSAELRSTLDEMQVLSKAVVLDVRDAQGHFIWDLSARPLRLCFNYDDAQVARAGGNAQSFVFLQNPGEADEREIASSRVDAAGHEVCAEIEQAATYALGARVPVLERKRVAVDADSTQYVRARAVRRGFDIGSAGGGNESAVDLREILCLTPPAVCVKLAPNPFVVRQDSVKGKRYERNDPRISKRTSH